MLDIIGPAAATLAAHADTVRILADISGDGTSNGAIWKIVSRVIMAVAVLGGAAFAVHALRVQMEKDPGKTKKLMDEFKAFLLFEGFLAVIWVAAELAGNIASGAAS